MKLIILLYLFLDVVVSKNQQGSLATNVYHNKTTRPQTASSGGNTSEFRSRFERRGYPWKILADWALEKCALEKEHSSSPKNDIKNNHTDLWIFGRFDYFFNEKKENVIQILEGQKCCRLSATENLQHFHSLVRRGRFAPYHADFGVYLLWIFLCEFGVVKCKMKKKKSMFPKSLVADFIMDPQHFCFHHRYVVDVDIPIEVNWENLRHNASYSQQKLTCSRF